jgi:glycosyltransferase involved in cell wall biosynthesis
VNGGCEVLRHQCERANGGLWYGSYAEWRAALANITPTQKEKLGRQGNAFVAENYSWDRVENDYLALLSDA